MLVLIASVWDWLELLFSKPEGILFLLVLPAFAWLLVSIDRNLERIARHTDNLKSIKAIEEHLLGLELALPDVENTSNQVVDMLNQVVDMLKGIQRTMDSVDHHVQNRYR